MLVRIETIVRGLLEDTGGSHDWEHTRRVVDLSRTIGAAEGADIEVVIAGAFLHDIGRNHQDGAGGIRGEHGLQFEHRDHPRTRALSACRRAESRSSTIGSVRPIRMFQKIIKRRRASKRAELRNINGQPPAHLVSNIAI